jgi:signal transduction histidine kinase
MGTSVVRRTWLAMRRADPRLADAVLAGVLTVALLGWLVLSRSGPAELVPLAGATLLTVPLCVRHRFPLWGYAAQLLGALVAHAALSSPVALVALVLGGYSVATVPGRRMRAAMVLGAAGLVLFIRYTVTGSSLVLLVVWLVASSVRSLRLRVQVAEQYAASLRREQRTAQLLAMETERARIARELHDVLGHHVTIMTIQTGAARQVMRTDPDEAGQALLAAEAAGRQAMAELRDLLRLLAPDTGADGIEDLAPPPGLAQLDALVAGTVTAGLPVTLCVEGAPRPLERGLDLAAYRVVQEGLTNALKHAPGASTRVLVRYRPDELQIDVLDQGMAAGERQSGGERQGGGERQSGGERQGGGDVTEDSRRGLLGLRERIAPYRGTFTAGRAAGGGYRIRARFPLEPT